jgi:hypothetical protein
LTKLQKRIEAPSGLIVRTLALTFTTSGQSICCRITDYIIFLYLLCLDDSSQAEDQRTVERLSEIYCAVGLGELDDLAEVEADLDEEVLERVEELVVQRVHRAFIQIEEQQPKRVVVPIFEFKFQFKKWI